MSAFKEKYASWAVITGASSGIGEEFGKQLAKEGLNLVLVARRIKKLEENADLLRRIFGVKVRTVSADLSSNMSYQKLYEATSDLEVGLLVNNAGAESHGNFVDCDVERARNIIRLNTIAPMSLAHHYSQKMLEKGRGGIIFVSSDLGYQGVPYFANYAATKAYILSFGEALEFELKSKGVDVTVLSPGLTNTEMRDQISRSGFNFDKTPIRTMEVEPVVRTALTSLGKRASVIPGAMNNVLRLLGKYVFTRRGITAYFGNMIGKAL